MAFQKNNKFQNTKSPKVLDKNSGYNVLYKISKILYVEKDSFDGCSEVIETNNIINFKCTSIKSLVLEGSLSIYKKYIARLSLQF